MRIEANYVSLSCQVTIKVKQVIPLEFTTVSGITTIYIVGRSSIPFIQSVKTPPLL